MFRMDRTAGSVTALPGLPRRWWSRFRGCGGQFAVLGVAEFDGDDVSGQGLAVRHGLDLDPVLAGIGRMVKCAGRAAHPDIGIICRQRAEDDVARHRNRLPGLAGIERALQGAVGGERPAGRSCCPARDRLAWSAGRPARFHRRERVRLPISQRRAAPSAACGLNFFLRLRSYATRLSPSALRFAPPSARSWSAALDRHCLGAGPRGSNPAASFRASACASVSDCLGRRHRRGSRRRHRPADGAGLSADSDASTSASRLLFSS